MLKETVTYTNYNDEEATDTLFFNLTKTEMLDMLDLQPRLEAWRNKTGENPSELTTEQILELVAILKDLIERAYGERSVDGKYFEKSPEIYRRFAQSAVYDSFIFGLFSDPTKAINFMIGILPKDLAEETSREMALLGATAQTLTDVSLPAAPEPSMMSVDKEVPAYLRENREPTKAELLTMSPDELRAAYARKNRSS